MKMRSLLKLLTCLMLATLLCFCALACDNGETASSSSSSSSSSSLPEPPPPPCEHTYTPTEAGCYCSKCAETFDHDILDDVCSVCGYEVPCEHTYTPTEAGCYCSKCEETFDHDILDDVCSVCGYEVPCEHTYTPTEAGCYCDKCKETFTHTIVDGACSDCGFVEDKSVDFSKFSAPFITKYYGNTKAAISLTFDDAQLETGYAANEMLTRYGLNGTIFFTLDYGKNPRISDTVRWNNWMSAWQAIIAEGTLDIGNHSYHHYSYHIYKGEENPNNPNENYATEIGDAHALLTAYFPGKRIITFATPGAVYCDETGAALAEYGYRFNRVGGTGMNDPYSYSFNPYTTSGCLYYTGASASTANGYVDNAIRNGMWFVEAYHYIATEDGKPVAGYADNWAINQGTISREFCEEHYAYIGQKVADGDIWCGTFNDVAAYVLERKHTTVAYTASTETSLTLSISCNELKDVAGYDHPLTLRVEVPSDWATVSATQGGASFTARSAVESGRNYIYIDVLPNGGDIVLSNVTE